MQRLSVTRLESVSLDVKSMEKIIMNQMKSATYSNVIQNVSIVMDLDKIIVLNALKGLIKTPQAN